MIISNNTSALMAESVQEFMESNRIDWNVVFAYSLMAGRRAERTEGIVKKRSAVHNSGWWANALSRVLYCYHRSERRNVPFPFRCCMESPLLCEIAIIWPFA